MRVADLYDVQSEGRELLGDDGAYVGVVLDDQYRAAQFPAEVVAVDDRSYSDGVVSEVWGLKRRSAKARLWLKIDLCGRGQVGPGKIELLERIHSERSIAAAARAMNMSYRRAWLLVAELNAACGRPVVATRTGGQDRGGAALTDLGVQLIAGYREVAEAARTAAAPALDRLLRTLQPRSAGRARSRIRRG